MIKSNIVGIIPCRFHSSRFPGKPLISIKGKPMMWHVYQKALASKSLKEVYIATDDQRIADSAKELNLNFVMTKNNHFTGTDRVSEVAQKIDADYYVNIQGDEPLIDKDHIREMAISILKAPDPETIAINAYASIIKPSDILNTNVVKVIIDVNSNAIAFSRQPIPYPMSGSTKYYQQLGLYAFKKSALDLYSKCSPNYLERAEGIEMYRLIENGHKVKMIELDSPSLSVDTPTDLIKVKAIIENSN